MRPSLKSVSVLNDFIVGNCNRAHEGSATTKTSLTYFCKFVGRVMVHQRDEMVRNGVYVAIHDETVQRQPTYLTPYDIHDGGNAVFYNLSNYC